MCNFQTKIDLKHIQSQKKQIQYLYIYDSGLSAFMAFTSTGLTPTNEETSKRLIPIEGLHLDLIWQFPSSYPTVPVETDSCSVQYLCSYYLRP